MEAELSRKSQSSRYRVPSLKTTAYLHKEESEGDGSTSSAAYGARKLKPGRSVDDDGDNNMASATYDEKTGEGEPQPHHDKVMVKVKVGSSIACLVFPLM